MKSKRIQRIRDTVYVVGAGFSAGLGYPLTKSLLIDAWERIPSASRGQLQRIIEFHHPNFSVKQNTSFPDIEQLLTEMVVNLQMFNASRPAEGRFTRKQLEDSRDGLLFAIAAWFHEIYGQASDTPWLNDVVKRFQTEKAAIVSFNWDLVLDQLLFSSKLDSQSYGLSQKLPSGPLLLKPHGSLNWYLGTQLKHVADLKRVEIFHDDDEHKCVHAFLRPRGVKSKSRETLFPAHHSSHLSQGLHASNFPAALEELHRRSKHAQKACIPRIFASRRRPARPIHIQVWIPQSTARQA